MATQATLLARGTHLTVRSTPAVTRPADAWNFISGTWSRLRDELAAAGQNLPALGAAVARTPVAPAAPAAKLAPAAEPVGMMSLSSGSPIERYVEQVSRLNGMLSCCVFDIATGHAQASLGAAPAAAELARFGASLLSSMSTASRALGLGTAQPEAAITLGAHHLVLRALPRHPGLVLHAVLDKSLANVTLAKLQIERLDALLG